MAETTKPASSQHPPRSDAPIELIDGGGDEELSLVGVSNANGGLPHARADCAVHLFGSTPHEQCCALCYCYVCDEPAVQCPHWRDHCDATGTGPRRDHWRALREAARRRRAVGLVVQAPPPPPPRCSSAHCWPCRVVRAFLETADGRVCYIGRDSLHSPGPTARLECGVLSARAAGLKAVHVKPVNACRGGVVVWRDPPAGGALPSWYRSCVQPPNNIGTRIEKCPGARRRADCHQLPSPPAPPDDLGVRLIRDTGCAVCGFGCQSTDTECIVCGSVAPVWPRYEHGGNSPRFELAHCEVTATIRVFDPRADERFRANWAAHPLWQYDAAAQRERAFKAAFGSGANDESALNKILLTTNTSRFELSKGDRRRVHALKHLVHIDDRCDAVGFAVRAGPLVDAHAAAATADSSSSATTTVRVILALKARAFEARRPVKARGSELAYRTDLTAVLLRLAELAPHDGDAAAASSENKSQIGDAVAAARGRALVPRDGALRWKPPTPPALNDAGAAADAAAASVPGAELESSAGSRAGGWASTDTSLRALIESHEAERERFVRKFGASLAVQSREANSSVFERARGLAGLMRELENRGHAEAPQPRALAVALREYQRQAVQWCLDQERLPGGVSSHCFAEVPGGEFSRVAPKSGDGARGPSSRLWFSPSLNMFRETAPPTTRGGIVAEEMGLGKTVISLALVLLNRPPPLASPPSAADLATWGEPPIPATIAPLRRVLSRATLVVCPVSLVGQWVDEARDKLVFDGSERLDVYQYYGGNRTDDPRKLADHDIVVTTFHVLASDLNARSNKAKVAAAGGGYVPICEQVCWWRIILDESHNIKGETANARASRNLHSHRRWCVTGTPANTSLDDLRQQLAFCGLAPFETDSQAFKDNFSEPHAAAGRRSNLNRFPIGLLPLLRRTVMRHAKDMRFITADAATSSGDAAAAAGDDRMEDDKPSQSLEIGELVIAPIEIGREKWCQAKVIEDLGDGIFKLEYKVDEINEWEGPMPCEYIERSSARADTLSPGDQVLVVVKEDEQLSGFHRLKSRYEPSLSEWWRLETVYAHRGDGTYTMVSSHATDHYHADAIIPRTSLTARPGRKLLELPPRHDHVTHVEFDDEERAAYERVAAQAKREAVGLFAQGDAVARSQTLRFLSLLTPLRSACSGGPIPTTIQTRHRKGADADDSDDDADAARQADVYAGASLMRSKLVTLLKALAEIRAADPSSKSLVFSQFASTLKWLQSELPRHGFSYRCITGDMSKNARAQALRDFREDPPTTIFLLSIKAGACGINLTQANHVFMMEPCLNPALEAQAVGRVHRMGQTRDCHITRLIIANSIEERIVDMLYKKPSVPSDADGGSAASPADGPGAVSEAGSVGAASEADRAGGASAADGAESTEGDETDIKPSAVEPVDLTGSATAAQDACASVAGNLARDSAKLTLEDFRALLVVRDSDTPETAAADAEQKAAAHEAMRIELDKHRPPVVLFAPPPPKAERKPKAAAAAAASKIIPPSKRLRPAAAPRRAPPEAKASESEPDTEEEGSPGGSSCEAGGAGATGSRGRSRRAAAVVAAGALAKKRAASFRYGVAGSSDEDSENDDEEDDAADDDTNADVAVDDDVEAEFGVDTESTQAKRGAESQEDEDEGAVAPRTCGKRAKSSSLSFSGSSADPSPVDVTALVGRSVRKKFVGYGWHSGTIKEIQESGKCLVSWDDGHTTTMNNTAATKLLID